MLDPLGVCVCMFVCFWANWGDEGIPRHLLDRLQFSDLLWEGSKTCVCHMDLYLPQPQATIQSDMAVFGR